MDDGSLDEVQTQKIAEETPSPHLQDHQYGQTPCYQVTRKPTQPPPRTEVNKPIYINIIFRLIPGEQIHSINYVILALYYKKILNIILNYITLKINYLS